MEYIIDAKNKKLGRLASEAAFILQGKKSAFYNPRLAGGDKVIVKNLDKINLSLKKMDQSEYHHHSGYMGHLKSTTLGEAWKKSPTQVLRMVVGRMLPNNYLKPKRLKRLIVE